MFHARNCLLLLATLLVADARAQQGLHYLPPERMPPGLVGATQLRRGGPLPGYSQPVEILAPEGSFVAVAVDGAFSTLRPTPLVVGLQIAPVYRLHVTGIPGAESESVFPTIEVIDRLYPPPGQEARFPIPIELTLEELRLALAGNFVTRVIYLEDPDAALPTAQDPKHPEWFDVGPSANPLLEADRLGRPVAILRMGGRVPYGGAEGDDPTFMGACAPVVFYKLLPPPVQIEQIRDVPAPPANQAPPAEAVPAAPAGRQTSRSYFGAERTQR